MNDLIVVFAQLGFACYLGAAVALSRWPAWVKWPAAVLAGLATAFIGLIVAALFIPGAMTAGYFITVPAALITMLHVSRKHRRAQQ